MSKFPTVLYRRDNYIERIKPFMQTPIVKVMIGHRRVGKSYILYQLIEEIRKEEQDANIIYINKEDIAYVDIVSSKDLHDYIAQRLIDGKKNYIFIDEIQEIKDFKVAVRSLAF